GDDREERLHGRPRHGRFGGGGGRHVVQRGGGGERGIRRECRPGLDVDRHALLRDRRPRHDLPGHRDQPGDRGDSRVGQTDSVTALVLGSIGASPRTAPAVRGDAFFFAHDIVWQALVDSICPYRPFNVRIRPNNVHVKPWNCTLSRGLARTAERGIPVAQGVGVHLNGRAFLPTDYW